MLKGLILIALILFVMVFFECVREIRTFKITRYKIQSPKLKDVNPRKVIFLSDLHNCQYGENNEKLLNAIKKESPDLILITGDMLVGKQGVTTDIAREFVGQLPNICPTFYSNGNHEQRMKENTEKYGFVYEEYKTFLQKQGVVFLENKCAQIAWDECKLDVFGLEIPRTCYGKFHKVSLPEKYVEDTLGKGVESNYRILLAHNPIFMKEYLDWGADLILSGHFHGGVVRIPFWRGVISSQGQFFPKYSGEMTKEGNSSVVVSKGIGIHTIPVRLFNPTEIVVLHIGDLEE